MDLSLSAYADDVVKAVPGPYLGRVEHLADRLQKSVEEMDKEFENAGFAQNRAKLVSVVNLTGPGCRDDLRKIASG